MRKPCTFLFYLLFPVVSIAQSNIGYSYDAAGNRVRREIVVQAVQNGEAKQQSLDSEKMSFSDMLCGHSIKINPNPATGNLSIIISGLTQSDRGSCVVYTPQGSQVVAGNIGTGNFNIALGGHPSGIYLLKISVNNNSTTWKIVKR